MYANHLRIEGKLIVFRPLRFLLSNYLWYQKEYYPHIYQHSYSVWCFDSKLIFVFLALNRRSKETWIYEFAFR